MILARKTLSSRLSKRIDARSIFSRMRGDGLFDRREKREGRGWRGGGGGARKWQYRQRSNVAKRLNASEAKRGKLKRTTERNESGRFPLSFSTLGFSIRSLYPSTLPPLASPLSPFPLFPHPPSPLPSMPQAYSGITRIIVRN